MGLRKVELSALFKSYHDSVWMTKDSEKTTTQLQVWKTVSQNYVEYNLPSAGISRIFNGDKHWGKYKSSLSAEC